MAPQNPTSAKTEAPSGKPTKLEPSEFRLISDYIERHCGIRITPEKTYLVETRLTTLMVESGCRSFSELHAMAVNDKTNILRDRVVDAMTTNETLWFRDQIPFEILTNIVLPEKARLVREGKIDRINIWSAACSTGQEPYSIAMTVLDFCRTGALRPEQVRIIGTDISPTVLFLAAAGRYDAVAMARGLDDSRRARYFKADGRVWAIDGSVKRIVEFRRHNLQDPLIPLGRHDIVFCRNVTIYFSDRFKKDLFERVARIMGPGGYLFLGGAESIAGYSNRFEILIHGKGMYHRVRL